MNIVRSRQRGFAILVGIALLLAVTLTAGALFAASASPQPQPQPAAPPEPAPERVSAQTGGYQEEIDLPPVTKEPPRHPNLDSNLNRLVEEAAGPGVRQDVGQQLSAADSAGGGSGAVQNPVLVTFYVEPEQIGNLRAYLEASGVFVRNVGEDYIEAHVPPPLLPEASKQPGVRSVDTVIPSQPQSLGRVVSQGVSLHRANVWHNAGYRGQNVRVGVIDTGFQGFSRLQGSELPANVTARCYFDGPRQPTSRLADCEVDSYHGTAVAETLVDVSPDVALYIANPRTNGDLRNAVDWMAGQGVKVINHSIAKVPDGPGNGTSPSSNSPLQTIDAAVSSGITWVNSGGNYARRTWYGTFSDPDRDDFHNFTTRDEGNGFLLGSVDIWTAVKSWHVEYNHTFRPVGEDPAIPA